MSKSDEMDNLIVDLINKFDATYQKIMDELPIKLKDPFLKVTFFVSNWRPRTSPSVFLSLYLVYKRQKRRVEVAMYICMIYLNDIKIQVPIFFICSGFFPRVLKIGTGDQSGAQSLD